MTGLFSRSRQAAGKSANVTLRTGGLDGPDSEVETEGQIRMSFEPSPWIASLVVLIVWMIVVFGGMILQAGGTTSLEAIVSKVSYSLIAAPIFLLVAVAYKGWWREVGLQPISNLAVLVVPGLAIIAVWILTFRRGLPRGTTLKLVGANTLLIGFSEELMFRGVLFYGAQSSFGSKLAVVITAAIFGLNHCLNGTVTGDWKQAAEQAILNVFSGFWLAALRVYLNSIIPLIAIHWLWDFGLFAVGSRKTVFVKSAFFLDILPLACELVLFMYAVWLLYA
jgi:membrane protease YdiL (CAAX protease family)